MKKLLFIFGTRPEAIKMAPLIKISQKYTDKFEVKVCITAQHRQMLDQVLKLFDIFPDFDLDLMKPNQDLSDLTANILLKLKNVFNEFHPDLILVHGDTTTTFAASLSAYYHNIPVAHVEAGLRTRNIYSPFPEEINRQLTSKIAQYHFAPTENAKNNLLLEGINQNIIFVTGNTVIDALLQTVQNMKNEDIKINGYSPTDRKMILVTGHRRENFGDGFVHICEALRYLALNNPEIDIVYPVHLNPNVQEPVRTMLGDIINIYLIDPLDYTPFVYLMSKSYIILTDSGGIQEEAPSLGKPVLVMRNTTERIEAVEAGVVKLIGTDRDTIIQSAQQLIDDHQEYDRISKIHNPYGDGKASENIIKKLLEVIP